ncbi:hypothetical protein ACP275_10G183600 [Erythranthe tilingii]
MMLLLGMVIGWFCTKILSCHSQNSVTGTTPVLPAGEEESIVEIRDVSPAHFFTKIESFSLFSNSGIESYECREFEAGGYNWRLIIYPNGHPSKEKKGNHVSVYLAMSETNYLPEDWELNVIFTIFLYNQILDNYLCVRDGVRRFSEAKSMWGFPKFISKKSLRDESSSYLVEDNFVVGAEVFVLKRQRVSERLTLFKPTTQKRVWKIRGFSKLDDDVWFSEEFTVTDVNWKVQVYPNGHPSVNGRYVSIFLICVSADSFAPHQKVKADFNIRLKGWPAAILDSGKISHWFTSSTRSRPLYEFVSVYWLHDPKSCILVKDCCTVEVEIYVQLVAK